MQYLTWMLLSAGLVFGIFRPASAQEALLLHLPLDGDFQNHGSLPGEVVLRTADGSPGPRPVEGKFGEALLFSGDSVLALPYDLSQAEYPDVTLTAWVKYVETSRSEHTIIASGAATLRVHNAIMKVVARGHGGVFPRPESTIRPGEWTFIAASINLSNAEIRYDMDGQLHTQQPKEIRAPRGSRKYADPADSSVPSQSYIFVGANNFHLQWPAIGLAIDDVRIYKGALSEQQVTALRLASTGSVAGISETVVADNALAEGAACGTHADCGNGFYCGWDRACHPENQLPIQELEFSAPECACEGDSVTEIVPLVPGENPAPTPFNPGVADPLQPVSEPIEATIGTPVPVGAALFGGITGRGGQHKVVMDLEDEFVQTIGWRPFRLGGFTGSIFHICGMHIDGENLADGPGPGSMRFTGFCDSPDPTEQSPIFDWRTDNAIVSLQACTETPDSKALTAVTGRAREIGVMGIDEEATPEQGPRPSNCVLENEAKCPARTALTGIAIYHDEENDDYSGHNVKYVTGIELICREVGLR